LAPEDARFESQCIAAAERAENARFGSQCTATDAVSSKKRRIEHMSPNSKNVAVAAVSTSAWGKPGSAVGKPGSAKRPLMLG
jgi:hypothetical protein